MTNTGTWDDVLDDTADDASDETTTEITYNKKSFIRQIRDWLVSVF